MMAHARNRPMSPSCSAGCWGPSIPRMASGVSARRRIALFMRRASIGPAVFAGSSSRQAICHGSEAREPEARSIASLLKEWGVPQNALLLETESRNTFENARLSRPIWDAHLFKPGFAYHLCISHAARPRRVPARGFQCRTVASRFWRQTTARRRCSRFMPDASALLLGAPVARGEGMIGLRV